MAKLPRIITAGILTAAVAAAAMLQAAPVGATPQRVVRLPRPASVGLRGHWTLVDATDSTSHHCSIASICILREWVRGATPTAEYQEEAAALPNAAEAAAFVDRQTNQTLTFPGATGMVLVNRRIHHAVVRQLSYRVMFPGHTQLGEEVITLARYRNRVVWLTLVSLDGPAPTKPKRWALRKLAARLVRPKSGFLPVGTPIVIL